MTPNDLTWLSQSIKANLSVIFLSLLLHSNNSHKLASRWPWNDVNFTLKNILSNNYLSGQYETTDHCWSTIGPIRISKPFEPPQLSIPRSYKKQIKIKNGQKLHLKIGFDASNESQWGCPLFYGCYFG